MGCADSKVQAVKPADTRQRGWAEGAQTGKDKNVKSEKLVHTPRDGSALSKGTIDSGVGFEDEPIPGSVPGTVAENSPSPQDTHDGHNTERALLGGGFASQQGHTQERAKSSDILEELMMQGIIQSQTKFVRNGEAYDVMMETTERPLKRPPAKLEKLKTKKKKNKSLTKEDIENKIRAAEERRKIKEEELVKRLRTERPLTARPLQSIAEYRGEWESMPEEEHTNSARARPTASGQDEKSESRKQISFLKTTLEEDERKSNSEDIGDLGTVEADNTFNRQYYTAEDADGNF